MLLHRGFVSIFEVFVYPARAVTLVTLAQLTLAFPVFIDVLVLYLPTKYIFTITVTCVKTDMLSYILSRVLCTFLFTVYFFLFF